MSTNGHDPTSSKTTHLQQKCDDSVDEGGPRQNGKTNSCEETTSGSSSKLVRKDLPKPPPWLREDCLEFYRNELLRKSSSSSLSSNPAIPVKDRVRLLRLAINRAMGVKKRFPNAQFLEFGVHEGKDLVRMAKFLSCVEEQCKSKPNKNKQNNNNNNNNSNFTPTTFHGFDSFEGLPEDWINGQVGTNDEPFHKKGAFDTGGESPDVKSLVGHRLNLGDHGNSKNSNKPSSFAANNVAFHKGWFHESLPGFLDEHNGTPVAFVHADADLYASTLTFLKLLCERKLFCKGSVIVFDEFWNYPHWQDGEFRAWNEIVQTFGLEYEYFGYHAPHSNAKRFKQYGYQSVGVVITSDMK